MIDAYPHAALTVLRAYVEHAAAGVISGQLSRSQALGMICSPTATDDAKFR